MVELVSTDDPVLLSWLMAQLADAEIGAVVFDSHTTALLPGTLGLIRSRVMVGDNDLDAAQRILAQAGEAP
ncbi:hypothetical protein CKO38_06090 [Rhodospirillum rubrum]|uniref:putative signal transducing protein n=1 Tax=Rhodospirillum rubrum TaxID=1085 RepID=UPI001903F909|nr:DUF2007 domain-containing protein [Rhodospirillum rubrum]MBK1664493.1 hypothetical protein [Rhodospirillum rubrum]MBK1676250.1 hypothetical protein [Rhodospirillum rubrum]